METTFVRERLSEQYNNLRAKFLCITNEGRDLSDLGSKDSSRSQHSLKVLAWIHCAFV